MIIYLHGFNSWGETHNKAKFLAEQLPEIDVYSPSYPSNDPDMAIQIVNNLISKRAYPDDKVMFVGSSMGGFFAQYLSKKHNGKCVLINPATQITKTLKRCIGENTNYVTNETYTLTEENVAAFGKYDVTIFNILRDNVPTTLLLLDGSDEVLDPKVALDKYLFVANCHVFAGGNHRFTHLAESVELIKSHYYAEWF